MILVDTPTEPQVSEAQVRQVERFLYREARLLDERRHVEWMTMLHDDVVSIIFNRFTPEPPPRATLPVEAEFRAEGGLQLCEDDLESLQYRIKRIDSGLTFSETPPGRTVRLVTNIEVFAGENPDMLHVESCLHCNRSRKEDRNEDFYARRKDILVAVDGDWRLLRRHVYLNQTLLHASTLSIFF